MTAKRRPLRFEGFDGHPIVVDANHIFLVQPATRQPDPDKSPEMVPGVVVLVLTNAPGTLFVKGEFEVVAENVFGG